MSTPVGGGTTPLRPALAPAATLRTTTPVSASAPSAAQAGWAERRPSVIRLCAGQALLIADAEADFIDLANNAAELAGLLLDDSADPDTYTAAEVALDYFRQRYGVERHAKGDRVKGIESAHRRYLLPFLVELEASRPVERRGVANLRIGHLETLSPMLAGDRPLPAATVAGDLLSRPGIACVYLSIADAAAVTTGGRPAIEVAVATGDLRFHRDVRTGADIIATADLRQAGLLVERTSPHGLASSSATNVLRDLTLAFKRAHVLGAQMRGD